MSADEVYETALATTGELLGQRLELPPAPGELAAGADFRKVATVHAFADSWTRTALSTHDRSLVSVAITATLGAESRCAASCASRSTTG
ncbi:hypothetical protein PV392_06850 [Streptomyces sp. ME03-5709C]|nr:hypothetical protein [Streptomyces sp. ME03-5709C]